MEKTMKNLTLVLLILTLTLVPLMTVEAKETDNDKLLIVASTTQIADFTRQIAGDRMRVHSILAAGADPHTYQPTPDDVQIVLAADLCLENGLHLEGKNWMETLAKDAGKPLVTTTTGIKALEIDGGGTMVADPHAWFSPRNVAVYVNNILKALEQIDPTHSSEFRARAKLFLQQLRILDAWAREQISQIPPDRRILVTTHDAFNYFCNEYRFNAANNYLSIAPVGWSTGSEVGGGMTPERRRMVVDSILTSGAPAIFVETSINPKLIREIARDTGIKIGGALYSDSMGEEDTAGETYIGMMRENILLIVEALK
jgi:manganese/iron transport system substrate-binding protein